MLDASAAKVSQVRVGAAASVVRTNGARLCHFAGTVEGVLPQTTPGLTKFAVKVDLPNLDGVLAAGIPVIGTLMAPPVRGVQIPVRAFRDDAHDGVMVGRGGRAQRVALRELTSDGTTAIVTNLTAGVHVVTNGALGLASGTRAALR